MLTMSADDQDLFESLKSGASGYLLKTQDTSSLFDLLLSLALGQVPLSPGLASRLLNEFTRQSASGLVYLRVSQFSVLPFDETQAFF